MANYHWTGGDLPTFVTHLECSLTGERYPADTLRTLSRAGARCWCAMISTVCAAHCPARGSPAGRRHCGAIASCYRCADRRTWYRSAR